MPAEIFLLHNISDECMGFRFFDQEVSDDGTQLPKNVSGWYYCNCEKMTFEDAKKVFNGDIHELKKYMEANGAKYIVRTKFRHFIPLRNEDTVL